MSDRNILFQMVRLAAGNAQSIDGPTAAEWKDLYEQSVKQSLVAFVFEGVKRYTDSSNQKPPLPLLYEWIGTCEQIKQRNVVVDKQCKELTEWFTKEGYESCVLKGQGAAKLYPEPNTRQSGDIDIWVDAGRDEIVALMRSKGIKVTVVDYVNCHAAFFEDTEVEVHFRPTWMYNPFVNKKVQKWLNENKILQMHRFDEGWGFAYPSVGFNLVFSLLHIYKHVLFEGIGLRQLTDYYFILQHATDKDRKEALSTLSSFGITDFTSTVMYVMKKVYGIDERLMLCTVDEKNGKFLLEEIMRGGNFGHYDDRNKFIPDEQRWKRGFNNEKRNMRYLRLYPDEVLWMPIWKMWHWGWRKWKGYL